MCDSEDDETDSQRPRLTRRRFGQVAGGLAATSLLPGVRWQRPARAMLGDGTMPVSMAMHIHSSFSELYGSMHGHLEQARQNAVDVIWWTEHDHRMSAHNYRQVVHFDSLTAETENGLPWNWVPERSATLTADSGGGIVSSPASPMDQGAAGSMAVDARSTGKATAAMRFFANSIPASYNYQANVVGQTISIEVFPASVGPGAFLEVRISTSWHPAAGGRPAGIYVLSYRLGGRAAPNSRVAAGLTGVVTLPTTPGQWNSVIITPAADIAALWPDLDSRDFSTSQLRLGAVSSNGARASGNFDFLRFARANTGGQAPLALQQDVMAAYAPQFPSVVQRRGLELSWSTMGHVNWFGGDVTLPDYDGLARSSTDYVQSLVDMVHTKGGLASYNHPFGVLDGAADPAATMDERRAKVATALLANSAYGCDLLEVGYRVRGHMDLEHHLSLWDVCSRNALFLTGNGVSDDHFGTGWAHFEQLPDLRLGAKRRRSRPPGRDAVRPALRRHPRRLPGRA